MVAANAQDPNRLSAARLGEEVQERLGLRPGETIVVGVSGGLDSTVLLRLLHETGFSAVAAHMNFGLRGVDADADEQFVRELGSELGVPVQVRQVALPEAGNLQAAAREARYAFFRHVAKEVGAEAVAVGHHLDDQAETLLLNLLRGAGPHGLAAMPWSRELMSPQGATIAQDATIVHLIRPLLGTARSELERLAQSKGWVWRDDQSNTNTRYRRNWVRHKLLPLLEEKFGSGVPARLATTADQVQGLLDEVYPFTLSIDVLRRLSPVTRHARYRAALASLSGAPRQAGAIGELDRLLEAHPGAKVEWPEVTVWRDRTAIAFVTRLGDPEQTEEAVAVCLDGRTETPQGVLESRLISKEQAEVYLNKRASPCTEVMDRQALVDPLVLRRWRHGDRIRPLGLSGAKRVSDVLTEAKVEPSVRAQQLVLCAGPERRIVWVVGFRLAHGARIRHDTQEAVCFTWHSAPPA